MPAAAQETITVFAAASMKNALDDVNAAFTKATGIKVMASYAASSALAKQIEQGAPADVFVSADLDWMDYRRSKKLIKDDTPRQSARQQAGADRAEGFQDRQRRRSARASTSPSSPATAASRSPTCARCRPANTPRRRWRSSAPGRRPSRSWRMAENVRAALALVARGEAPLGIVYETDAKVEPNVKIVGAFPGRTRIRRSPIRWRRPRTPSREAGAVSRTSCARRAAKAMFETIWLHVPGQADVVTSSTLRVRPHPRGMDRGRAVAARSRWSRPLVALPFGIAVAWLLARKDFWGKALLDGVVHLPLVLPPVVTGYLLLIAFGRRGAGRRVPRRPFRHRVLVPLDRRGARLRRDGVSAAGARHPAVVRGDRPPARGRRRDARRQPAAGCSLTVTLPLALPGIIAGMVLCFAKALGEFGATITFVSNIPGETQTISAAIYTLHAGARRRCRRAAAGRRRHRHLARRADRVGMVRARAPARAARGLTMLAVDVEKRLGDFAIAAKFEARGRRHRAVRPVRRGQDHDRQHDRRAC